MTKSEMLWVRMSPEEKKRIAEIAEKDMRTISSTVRIAIQFWLERQDNEKNNNVRE